MKRTRITAAAISLLAGSSQAMAELITVLDPNRTVVSDGSVFLGVLRPELNLGPGDEFFWPNSIRFDIGVNSSGQPIGQIYSNYIPDGTPGPPPTAESPSLLLAPAAEFQLEGFVIDGNRDFQRPLFDPDKDVWLAPSLLSNIGNVDFDFLSVPDGEYGYVGIASGDVSQFGYVQLQRLSVNVWTLVGYRYDPSGSAVVVENLVPAPSAILTLTPLLAPIAVRRRH